MQTILTVFLEFLKRNPSATAMIVVGVVSAILALIWYRHRIRSSRIKDHSMAWMTTITVPALNKIDRLQGMVLRRSFGWSTFSSMNMQLDKMIEPEGLEEAWRIEEFRAFNRKAARLLKNLEAIGGRITEILAEVEKDLRTSPAIQRAIVTCINAYNANPLPNSVQLNMGQAELEIRRVLVNGMEEHAPGSIYDGFWVAHRQTIERLRSHVDVVRIFHRLENLRIQYLDALKLTSNELEMLSKKWRKVVGPLPDSTSKAHEETFVLHHEIF